MVNSPLVFSDTSSAIFSTCSVKARRLPQTEAFHSVAAACEAKAKVKAQTAAPFSRLFIDISLMRAVWGPLGRNTILRATCCQPLNISLDCPCGSLRRGFFTIWNHAPRAIGPVNRQSVLFPRVLAGLSAKFTSPRRKRKNIYRQTACFHMLISFFSLPVMICQGRAAAPMRPSGRKRTEF